MLLEGRARAIEPRSGFICQQGSSANSFLDLGGLHRTKTCTFSRIDVDFVEKEGFGLKELVDDVGLGYTV